MPLTVYGIPNCNTVKKACDWLQANGIAYTFYDVKKQGVTPALLNDWLNQWPLDQLINRSGLTWRSLSEDTKRNVDSPAQAIALMLEKPTVIKRPVLVQDERVIALGFSIASYQALFRLT